MNKTELLELISNGQNSGVEFKRDDLRPEQSSKEVVALANFQGGRILVGIEDDGTITGIQQDDLEHWVMDTVFSRKVHPMVLPFYEEVRVDERLRVAVITIGQGLTSRMLCAIATGRTSMFVWAARRVLPPANNRRSYSRPGACFTRSSFRCQAAASTISVWSDRPIILPPFLGMRGRRRPARNGKTTYVVWVSWLSGKTALQHVPLQDWCFLAMRRVAFCVGPAFAGWRFAAWTRATKRWMTG